MYPYYKAEIVDVNGNTLSEIDDLISVEAARAFNTAGSATIIVPAYYAGDLFRMHTRMKLWRYDWHGRSNLFGDTIWFLKKIDLHVNESARKLEFVDAFAMLATRVVAYTSQTPYADKTLEEFGLITYDASLRLDTMMLAYMRENFGSLALDAERTNTAIDIMISRNRGPYGEKQAAWQEMDSVLADLASQAAANGLNLYYDLIPVEDGTFRFRIWERVRGVDRGSDSNANLTLNDTDGLLTEIHEIEDYSNVATVCYVLGYDSGPSQVIAEVQSPLLILNDPFGRIEMTVNSSDAEEATVLAAAGQSALNGRRAKRLVTAKVVENSSLVYGHHLNYGDLISIEIAGRKYDVAVKAVSTRWDEAGEQLDIQLSGEEAIGPLLTPGTTTPGIGVPGEGNMAPVANAGPDMEVTFGDEIVLAGSATDDGLP